jgi:hypothetical protein
MGILTAVKLHPSAAAPMLTNAYLMIDRADYSRVNRTLSIHLACFASAAEREAYKAALAAVLVNADIVDAGDGAAAIALPADPSPEQIADVTAQRTAATAAYLAARSAWEAAVATVRGIVPVQPVGLPLTAAVPMADIAGCLGTDGAPDVAKCYAWLAAHGYAGAEA